MLKSSKKISFYNIGCKVNYADLSQIREDFASRGYEIVEFGDNADIVLINTCTVTHNADADARKIIRRAKKSSPNAFIGVLGCYAQLKPDEIAKIEGVNAIFGTEKKFQIPDILSKIQSNQNIEIFCSGIDSLVFEPSVSSDTDSRTRAIVKLQDGCDYKCSYCTIPLARGNSRSMEFSEIIPTIKKLENAGYKEVILSGINLGEYRSSDGKLFSDVLKLLSNTETNLRFRISSIEPNLVTDDIIETVAKSHNICHHFHIPLQSGSNDILKLMRRRYNVSRYRDVISKIKDQMPHSCIGADVITGHPGESDKHFEETYNLIESLPISYLHVFTYSERPNTFAINLPDKVQFHKKNYRTAQLRKLSEIKRNYFNSSQIGHISKIVIEKYDFKNYTASGWSDNYIYTYLHNPNNILGEVVTVRISKIIENQVFAEYLELL